MAGMDEETAGVVANALLRAMVAVAGADGSVRDNERMTIKGFLQESLGTAPDDATIDQLHTALDDFDGTIREVISADIDKIPQDVRPAIVQGCFFVITASQPVTPAQEQAFAMVGEGLQMTQEAFDKSIEAAHDLIERANAADQQSAPPETDVPGGKPA